MHRRKFLSSILGAVASVAVLRATSLAELFKPQLGGCEYPVPIPFLYGVLNEFRVDGWIQHPMELKNMWRDGFKINMERFEQTFCGEPRSFEFPMRSIPYTDHNGQDA